MLCFYGNDPAKEHEFIQEETFYLDKSPSDTDLM